MRRRRRASATTATTQQDLHAEDHDRPTRALPNIVRHLGQLSMMCQPTTTEPCREVGWGSRSVGLLAEHDLVPARDAGALGVSAGRLLLGLGGSFFLAAGSAVRPAPRRSGSALGQAARRLARGRPTARRGRPAEPAVDAVERRRWLGGARESEVRALGQPRDSGAWRTGAGPRSGVARRSVKRVLGRGGALLRRCERRGLAGGCVERSTARTAGRSAGGCSTGTSISVGSSSGFGTEWTRRGPRSLADAPGHDRTRAAGVLAVSGWVTP